MPVTQGRPQHAIGIKKGFITPDRQSDAIGVIRIPIYGMV